MINSNCYIFEKREYKNGFLDSFVDATYILTLEGSKRKDDYENQLKEYIPTKILYIVHNKGYKKCNKDLYKQIPPYDLVDAHLTAMNHSLENNYNNILILEDDFIFDKQIKNKKIINEIETLFNKKNSNNSFFFNLGAVPFIFNIIPNSNIYKGIYALTSHSIIYNKNILIKIMNDKNKKYHYMDHYIAINYSNYFYKFPLCYQTFPNTDNNKYWGEFRFILNYFIKFLKINIDVELGWTNLYSFLFFINYLLFIIIILFIFLIIYFIFNVLKIKNKNNKYKII